jgi:NADH-quinone oxidoreductase subunit C
MSLMSSDLKMTFRSVPVAPVPNLAGTGVPKSIDQISQDLSKLGSGLVKETAKEHNGDPFVVVDTNKIIEALRFLRDDERYLCTMLQVVSAVDYPPEAQTPAQSATGGAGDAETPASTKKAREPRIEVIYVLWSFVHKHQIMVKVHLDRHNPRVPSVCDLYRAANWYERECYDMLGVIFTDHPNLKRILLPEDWVGHPLRRDYVFPEEYNGMKVPL